MKRYVVLDDGETFGGLDETELIVSGEEVDDINDLETGEVLDLAAMVEFALTQGGSDRFRVRNIG